MKMLALVGSSPDGMWLRSLYSALEAEGISVVWDSRRPSLRAKLRSALAREARWDVVHAPSIADALGSPAVREGGARVVLSCHAAELELLSLRRGADGDRLRRETLDLFQRVSAVHCYAEAARERACELGAPEATTRVIAPWVTGGARSVAEHAAGPFVILDAAPLLWQHGHEVALEAVRLVRAQNVDVRYTIAGHGPEKSRVLFTIDDLGLTDCVSVEPIDSLERLERAGASSHVYLQSSIAEGAGHELVWAMRSSLPIVATEGVAASSLVRDGLVVPNRSPHALAAALVSLATDEEARRSLGAAGHARAQAELDPAAQLAAWRALLADVMRQGAAPLRRS